MAILDPLTGLHNHRFMTKTLFGEASRHGQLLAVLLIDIDHFKGVNDSHGHDVGDAGAPTQFARPLPAWRRGVRRGNA